MRHNLFILVVFIISWTSIFAQPTAVQSQTEPLSPEEALVPKAIREATKIALGTADYPVFTMSETLFRRKTYKRQTWTGIGGMDINIDSTYYNYVKYAHISDHIGYKFVNGVWNEDNRRFYSYDSVYNLSEVLTETFDSTTWNPESNTTYFYNADGQNSQIKYDKWDSISWVPFFSVDRSYDNNKNETEYLFSENYDGTGMKPNYKFEYTYDSNDRRTSSTYSENFGSGLELEERIAYNYNSNTGYLDTTVEQLWNSVQWVNNRRIVRDFSNELVTIELNQIWSGSQWLDEFRYLFEYDSLDHEISRVFQKPNGAGWEVQSRRVNTWTGEYITIIEYQSLSGGVWEPFDRRTYFYDEDGNLLWDYYEIGTDLHKISENTYTYESYDSTSTSIDGLLTPVDHKVYPNPFNDQLTVEYNNDAHEVANLVIYSIDGKMIMGIQASGSTSEITWKGTDAYGKTLPNGIYTYKLVLGDKASTGKVVLSR